MTNINELINFFHYVCGVQGGNGLLYNFVKPNNTPETYGFRDAGRLTLYEQDLSKPSGDIKEFFEGNHRILLYPHKVVFGKTGSTDGLMLWPNRYLQEINFVIFDVDVRRKHKNKLGRSDAIIKKNHAQVIANRIMSHLKCCGYRKMMLVDSGNGYHVFLPIKISLTDADETTYKQRVREYLIRCAEFRNNLNEICGVAEFDDSVHLDDKMYGHIKQFIKSAGSVNRKEWEDFHPRVSKRVQYENGCDGGAAISQNTSLFELIPIDSAQCTKNKELSQKLVYRDFIEQNKELSPSMNAEIQTILNLYAAYTSAKTSYFISAKLDRSILEYRLLLALLKIELAGFEIMNHKMCVLLCDVVDAKWLCRDDDGYRMNQYEKAYNELYG